MLLKAYCTEYVRLNENMCTLTVEIFTQTLCLISRYKMALPFLAIGYISHLL